MHLFHHDSKPAIAHEEVTNAPHKAKLSHEALAAAASYEAAKKYENHVAANGRPASHEKAKEMLAAFSGAFIDRIVESKGQDEIDSRRAKGMARNQTEEAYVNSPAY